MLTFGAALGLHPEIGQQRTPLLDPDADIARGVGDEGKPAQHMQHDAVRLSHSYSLCAGQACDGTT
jgi:hypothetical protein